MRVLVGVLGLLVGAAAFCNFVLVARDEDKFGSIASFVVFLAGALVAHRGFSKSTDAAR